MRCGKNKKFELKRIKMNHKTVIEIHDTTTNNTVILGKCELRNAWRLLTIGE